MKLIKTGDTSWTNRHECFTEEIKDLYIAGNEPDLGALDGYNDTTKAFQQLIADAIASKTPFRSLGAGWSWSKIATVKGGIMMDTKPLNTVLNISAASVSPAYKGDSNKLLFAQCGTGIWEIGRDLRSKKLSLKTSGASNGQTIVGAMSTGAHGSSFDVGAVQDYVVGMHIIVGPNRHIWLERKSYPVVNDNLISRLETELLQDDDLFNAALVSFGSFGIIHGVMIETEDIFLLETYMRRMPYDATLKQLMQTLDFSHANNLPCGNERPFHFEVRLNPYDMDKGAYVSTFYKRTFRTKYTKAVPNNEGIGPGDDAPCFMGKLTDALPVITPFLVNTVLGGAMTLFEKQLGTLVEIFNNTTVHGKVYSSALGLPLDRVNQVTDILFTLNQQMKFAGLFAFRFIKKSKATLAFTRFDYTCILELDGAFSSTTLDFYRAIWQKLDDENIPYTVHWGKMNELTPARINKMYGNDAVAWMAARSKLLDADSRAVFSNPLLQLWELDKVL